MAETIETGGAPLSPERGDSSRPTVPPGCGRPADPALSCSAAKPTRRRSAAC